MHHFNVLCLLGILSSGYFWDLLSYHLALVVSGCVTLLSTFCTWLFLGVLLYLAHLALGYVLVCFYILLWYLLLPVFMPSIFKMEKAKIGVSGENFQSFSLKALCCVLEKDTFVYSCR